MLKTHFKKNYSTILNLKIICFSNVYVSMENKTKQKCKAYCIVENVLALQLTGWAVGGGQNNSPVTLVKKLHY